MIYDPDQTNFGSVKKKCRLNKMEVDSTTTKLWTGPENCTLRHGNGGCPVHKTASIDISNSANIWEKLIRFSNIMIGMDEHDHKYEWVGTRVKDNISKVELDASPNNELLAFLVEYEKFRRKVDYVEKTRSKWDYWNPDPSLNAVKLEQLFLDLVRSLKDI